MNRPVAHLALALTVFVAVLAGYWYWSSAVAGESAKVVSLNAEIAAATLAANRAAVARVSLDDVSSDEAAVAGYFVAPGAAVPFIDDLQSIGSTTGADVAVSSVSATTLGTQPALALSLAVAGSFDAVMRTVGAIEYAPYDLSITGLSVAQTAENAWTADFTLAVGSATASTTSP